MTLYIVSAIAVFIFSGLLAMAGRGVPVRAALLLSRCATGGGNACRVTVKRGQPDVRSCQLRPGKLINWRVGLPVLIAAVILSPIGARLTPFVDKKILLGMFAAFLVFAGFMMLFYKAKQREQALSRGTEISAGAGVGSLAGFVGGLLGVGGGNFILPVLNWIGLDAKVAAGTTALVVVFSSLSGFLGHATLGGLDPVFLGINALMAALGSIVGSQLMKTKISSSQLKKIIGVLLSLIAIKMIFDVLK